jgi:hypothetical protein
MNIKTIAIVTAMTCATAGAAIIPITPTDWTNPKIRELLSPPNTPLVGGFYFQDDWCGCYALKNRPDLSSLIHTDYFQHRPTDLVTMSWNLPDTYPVGGNWDTPFFRVNAVAVYNSVDLAVYEVTGPNKFNGQVTVTMNSPIQQIYLYGTVIAPDNGSTLAFLGGALVALLSTPMIFKTTTKQ